MARRNNKVEDQVEGQNDQGDQIETVAGQSDQVADQQVEDQSEQVETVETVQTKTDGLKYDPERLKSYTTKSGAIRYLNGCGLSTGQISKVLGIRYQHVRNVLITPVTKAKENSSVG